MRDNAKVKIAFYYYRPVIYGKGFAWVNELVWKALMQETSTTESEGDKL